MAGDDALTTARDTVLPHFALAEQTQLVDEVRRVCAASPLVRPRTPNGLPMRVRVTAAGKVGWVGDGAYRYDERDGRGNTWPAMPPRWARIATEAAGEHPWDCAIVNWYDADASLGWHRDQSERDLTLPIVTISLGDAARWAIRADESAPVSRCTIQSGDVTVLREETRNWLHSIERIKAEPMFSPLKCRGRVSITIRVAT